MYVDRTDIFSWTVYLQSSLQNDQIMTLHSKNVASLSPQPDICLLASMGNLITNPQG